MKIMASGPITSWELVEETVETVTDFIFLGSKITADGDCSHEVKRHLLAPWKKSYDQPRQHTKIRDILMSLMTLMTFNGPKKGPSSQSFVFSSSHVWM